MSLRTMAILGLCAAGVFAAGCGGSPKNASTRSDKASRKKTAAYAPAPETYATDHGYAAAAASPRYDGRPGSAAARNAPNYAAAPGPYANPYGPASLADAPGAPGARMTDGGTRVYAAAPARPSAAGYAYPAGYGSASGSASGSGAGSAARMRSSPSAPSPSEATLLYSPASPSYAAPSPTAMVAPSVRAAPNAYAAPNMRSSDGGTIRPYPVMVQQLGADGRPVQTVVARPGAPGMAMSGAPSCPPAGPDGAVYLGCGLPPPGRASLPPVMTPELRRSLGVKLNTP